MYLHMSGEWEGGSARVLVMNAMMTVPLAVKSLGQ